MRRRPRRQAVRIREPGRTRSAMVSRIRTAPSRPRHPIGQSASRIYEVYHKYPLDFLDPTLQGDGRNFRTKPRLHLPASKEHCENQKRHGRKIRYCCTLERQQLKSHLPPVIDGFRVFLLDFVLFLRTFLSMNSVEITVNCPSKRFTATYS